MRKRHVRWAGVAGVVLAAALVATGCGKGGDSSASGDASGGKVNLTFWDWPGVFSSTGEEWSSIDDERENFVHNSIIGKNATISDPDGLLLTSQLHDVDANTEPNEEGPPWNDYWPIAKNSCIQDEEFEGFGPLGVYAGSDGNIDDAPDVPPPPPPAVPPLAGRSSSQLRF